MRRILMAVACLVGFAGVAESQTTPYLRSEWQPGVIPNFDNGSRLWEGCTTDGLTCHHLRMGGDYVRHPDDPFPGTIGSQHVVWWWNSVHEFNAPATLGQFLVSYTDGPPPPVPGPYPDDYPGYFADYLITPSLCTDVNAPCVGRYDDDYQVLPSGNYHYTEYYIGRFVDNARVLTVSLDVILADGTTETVTMKRVSQWSIPEPTPASLVSLGIGLLFGAAYRRRTA